MAFTVIPAGEGSLVQHRMWIEATINGSLHTVPMNDRELISLVEGALTDLAGIVRQDPSASCGCLKRSGLSLGTF